MQAVYYPTEYNGSTKMLQRLTLETLLSMTYPHPVGGRTNVRAHADELVSFSDEAPFGDCVNISSFPNCVASNTLFRLRADHQMNCNADIAEENEETSEKLSQIGKNCGFYWCAHTTMPLFFLTHKY